MSRKAKFDELGWFSIENYRVFSDITVEEMINEILIRYNIMVNLKAANKNELDARNSMFKNFEKQYDCIINGNPRLYEHNKEWSNQEINHFKRKNTIKKTNLEKTLHILSIRPMQLGC